MDTNDNNEEGMRKTEECTWCIFLLRFEFFPINVKFRNDTTFIEK